MKKWKSTVILALLLCLIPCCAALAKSGKVTASSLNIRKSADADSKVVGTLREGDSVTIKDTSGSWYKITAGSKSGYVYKKYIKVTDSSDSDKKKDNKKSDTKSANKDGTCEPGDTGEGVKKVQRRLKKLGYYDGSIDGDYGSGTKAAVKSFQKKNGLNVTGRVNKSTLDKLNSSGAKKADSSDKKDSGSSDGTCAAGDSGDAVRKVQRRLKKLGYYKGSIDGDFGSGTKDAVKRFQKKNGLSVNGRVNKNTLTKLNSSGAKKAGDEEGSGKTEKLNWFNGGSRKIPKGATFKVKDIKTGRVFTVKRWSGANHLDAEPSTKSDTATLKGIYGGWSWKRRAILVKYNGHVYAASMNGMPHGTQTITNNNFDGHFCIHFSGSKTHGSKKVDAMHQNCVKEALKHSW